MRILFSLCFICTVFYAVGLSISRLILANYPVLMSLYCRQMYVLACTKDLLLTLCHLSAHYLVYTYQVQSCNVWIFHCHCSQPCLDRYMFLSFMLFFYCRDTALPDSQNLSQ